MASIDKRDSASGARYDVRYRDPSRQLRKKTFARKVDAERFAKTTGADLVRGEWTDPRGGQVRFVDWLATWRATTTNLRPSTVARDESYLRSHVLPRFGERRLVDIDHMAVRSWVTDLSAGGLAPATVVKAAQIMGKVMRAAVDAGKIKASPCERIPLPKIEREEMRYLAPAEVASLADAIDPRYRALVFVGAYGGLRLGELAGLKRRRVDLLHGRVDVAEIVVEVRGTLHSGPPKTRAGRRSVPLPRSVVVELEDHFASIKGEMVFPAPEGGPLRGGLFRSRFWAPAVKAAGLEPLRIHDLRHTAVAFWIAAGASANEIAARAGHASVVTVLDRYGHRSEGAEDRVTDALDVMAQAAAPAGIVRAIRG